MLDFLVSYFRANSRGLIKIDECRTLSFGRLLKLEKTDAYSRLIIEYLCVFRDPTRNSIDITVIGNTS